ncbi:hypothetical protein ACFQX6_03500 [Streptosporangium lutulentum]
MAAPDRLGSLPGQGHRPGGTALTHDLRTAPDDVWGDPGFHYVDGELLVYWQADGSGDGLRGYWHSSAGTILPMEGMGSSWALSSDLVTLPLPGGGRTTGSDVLHPGDTTVPDRHRLMGDGTSFWKWDKGSNDWREYDPAGMADGQLSMPGFLTDALRSAPSGSAFRSGWLLPALSDEATPAGVPVGGLLGWRVVELPDGSRRGEDLAGRTVNLGGGGGRNGTGSPAHAVTFPGDDRPRALTTAYGGVNLVDPEGVVVATAALRRVPGAFAEGTVLLPPVRYWRCMRPRDPEGSTALRRIDGETAAALLKAANSFESARSSPQGQSPQDAQSAQDELYRMVRALLPQITHDAVVAGVAGWRGSPPSSRPPWTRWRPGSPTPSRAARRSRDPSVPPTTCSPRRSTVSASPSIHGGTARSPTTSSGSCG